MGSHERGMKHTDATGKTEGAKVLGAPLSPRGGREGATRHLQDNLKNFQSYRRFTRAFAIPEVVSKSMAIEPTGGETTVYPPVGER
jgi:hypothetical protein